MILQICSPQIYITKSLQIIFNHLTYKWNVTIIFRKDDDIPAVY